MLSFRLLEHGAKRELLNRDGETAAAMMQDNRYVSFGGGSGSAGIPTKNPSLSYVPRPLPNQYRDLQQLLTPASEREARDRHKE